MFPTLSSAMTGYTGVLEAYVEDHGRNLVPWDQFSGVRYIIEDGDWILGLGRRHPVSDTDEYGLYKATRKCMCSTSPCVASSEASPIDRGRDTKVDIHLYSLPYDQQKMNRSSMFNIMGQVYHLNPPTLNITIGSSSYAYQNQTYGFFWLNDHVSCQSNGSTYQWGFSFLLLFIFCVFTMVWCLGMYAMWMDADQNSRVARSGQKPGGTFRSVIDLATAIREDLGDGAGHLSNGELDKRLKRSKGGLNLSTDALPLSRAKMWKPLQELEESDGQASFKLGSAVFSFTFAARYH